MWDKLKKAAAAAIGYDREPAWRREWRAHYEAEEYDKALALIEDLEPEERNSDQGLLSESDTLYRMERYDEARERDEQLRIRFPESPIPYRRIAYSFGEQGEYSQALVFLHRARELDSEHPETLQLLASAHYSLGEFDEARDYANEGLAKHPEDPYFVGMLGMSLSNLGEHGKAIAFLERVHEMKGITPGLIECLVNSYQVSGHYDEALRLCDEFIPDSEYAIASKFHCCVKLGKYERLLDISEEWRPHQERPGESEAMKVEAYRRMGRKEEALTLLNEYEGQFPDCPDLLVEIVLLRRDSMSEANYDNLVERIREIDPEMLEFLDEAES